MVGIETFQVQPTNMTTFVHILYSLYLSCFVIFTFSLRSLLTASAHLHDKNGALRLAVKHKHSPPIVRSNQEGN